MADKKDNPKIPANISSDANPDPAKAVNSPAVEIVGGADSRIRERQIQAEMKESYINYSMSVIVARALPDVRDGLKPVHRRVLFGMSELGNHSNKPYKKSARIVGEVLGKYHPHGDTAVYDTLVRMAQNFSLRYPLVDGQGNFGSVDGDSAAAMRYTEVRLAKPAEEMLGDLDKQTVDFTPNFDGSLEEPAVLPSALPNLLINGSSGIAVGMATNIPPHNLREVCDAIFIYIDNPQCTVPDLMKIVPGPDFPTGGIICGRSGIHTAYTNGKGTITVRGKVEVVLPKAKVEGESEKKSRTRIIISELPYQVNKARLVEQIAELVNDKKIEGIADLRDESDRDGMRVLVELKRDANPDIVLNQLYEHTPLQSTFGIINLSLYKGEPRIMGLKEMISCYVEHRQEVVTRRSRFELEKARAKAHILEGLKIALANIDEVIRIVRKSKDAETASVELKARLKITQEQAAAILDMKIQRLTGLEREKLDAELRELLERITYLTSLLSDVKMILAVVKEELAQVRDRYGDSRKTQITDTETDLLVEDLIPHEKMVVTITNNGYIKRMPLSEYEIQRRGGRGLIGVEAKEADIVTDIITADTHDYLLFFTDKGRVHWLKVFTIPEAGRYSAGKAIVNLLEVESATEKVRSFVSVTEFNETEFLVFCTKNGIVKKTPLSDYSNPRKGGIIAINLREGDDLITVKRTNGANDLILATKLGQSIRFSEDGIRDTGRASSGVIGIRMDAGDEVVGMAVANEDETLLTVCENGYGKRTLVSEYRQQSRGGKGVINIQATDRNGNVVAVRPVRETDEIMLVSSEGVIIRIPASGISVIGRNTQGVRVMKMSEGAKVVALDIIAAEAIAETVPSTNQ